MSKATSESEHLKDMLVGNILAVSWPEVGKTALLYGAVGVFHYVFRHKFLAISMDPKRAEAEGISIRLWDFLFYASFGFVVTSSVAIAGVLLVFCYLIVPSVAAMLYADHIGKRLAIGWSMGTIVSALGVYLSLVLDLPTGATIVCTFGLALAIMAAAQAAPSTAPCGSLRMRCRQCGTEIADKALICYRCGTATTEAKFKAPAAADRRRPRRSLGYAVGARALGPAGDPAAARAFRLPGDKLTGFTAQLTVNSSQLTGSLAVNCRLFTVELSTRVNSKSTSCVH